MNHNKKFQVFFSVLLILALAVGMSPAGSAKAYGTHTIYVRPDGNDDQCTGTTNVAHSIGTDCAFLSLQHAVDVSVTGDIIYINNDGNIWNMYISSPVTIGGNRGVQIILGKNVYIRPNNGTDSCFIVAADGVRISAEVMHNGACVGRSSSKMIYVNANVNNLIIDGLYFAGTSSSGVAGIYFAGAITNLQILNNYFTYLNGGRDLEFTTTPAGSVIDIKGNYFTETTIGDVLLPADSTNIDLNYNSWGREAGPTATDITALHGASYANFTYALPIIDFGSHNSSTTIIGDNVTVGIYMNTARLTGADFVLTFPQAKAQYVSYDKSGTDFNSNAVVDVSSASSGIIKFHGLTKFTDGTETAYAPLTKSWAVVYTVTFHMLASGDVDFVIPKDTQSFTMATAGPSNVISADWTQRRLVVYDAGTVLGTVSMQGRIARDGVTMKLYQPSTSTIKYTADSLSLDIMTNNISFTNVVDGAYTVDVVKAGYLTLPYTLNKSATFSSIARALKSLELKGGDVNNDNSISLTDASSVGLDYGSAQSNSRGTTDINTDGTVNIYDLALVGGNYGFDNTSSDSSTNPYYSWATQ